MLPQRVRLRIIADFYLQLWRQELAVFLSGCEEMPVKNSIHSDGVYFSHFLVAVIDTTTKATCRRNIYLCLELRGIRVNRGGRQDSKRTHGSRSRELWFQPQAQNRDLTNGSDKRL